MDLKHAETSISSFKRQIWILFTNHNSSNQSSRLQIGMVRHERGTDWLQVRSLNVVTSYSRGVLSSLPMVQSNLATCELQIN